jgi:hypothetical protein
LLWFGVHDGCCLLFWFLLLMMLGFKRFCHFIYIYIFLNHLLCTIIFIEW